MNNEFDEWFNALEGYHLVSEVFYSDLDHLVKCHIRKEEAENTIKDWLALAFQAGVNSEKEKTSTQG